MGAFLFFKKMITCLIKDASGEILGKFEPKGEKNLLDEAADAGIELPFSCHAGACMACAAKITAGADMIDGEKDGPKYMETDEDVALTCIAGVRPEFVDDEEEHLLEITMLG